MKYKLTVVTEDLSPSKFQGLKNYLQNTLQMSIETEELISPNQPSVVLEVQSVVQKPTLKF